MKLDTKAETAFKQAIKTLIDAGFEISEMPVWDVRTEQTHLFGSSTPETHQEFYLEFKMYVPKDLIKE